MMTYIVLLLIAVDTALLMIRYGVAPIVAAMLAVPLAVALWIAGCFAYGAMAGVVAAFRQSFNKDRI